MRAKRMVEEGRAAQDEVDRLHRACLEAIRRFDQGQISAKETLNVVEEYDQLFTPDRRDTRLLLRATLEETVERLGPPEVREAATWGRH